jgi:hypothetical protein
MEKVFSQTNAFTQENYKSQVKTILLKTLEGSPRRFRGRRLRKEQTTVKYDSDVFIGKATSNGQAEALRHCSTLLTDISWVP